MVSKKINYRLVDESPWPFLVSTASLFLTLGAVLFFHFFVQGSDFDVSVLMISFSTLKNKIKTSLTSAFVSVGSSSWVLINKKFYASRALENRQVIYKDVTIDPANYSTASKIFLKNLIVACENNDTKSICNHFVILLSNPNNMFSDNYGKLNSAVNQVINSYNTTASKENKITEQLFSWEKEFFISPTSVNNAPHDQYNSLVESLTMEVANRKNSYIEYKRNLTLEQYPHIANLGGQPDNDCVAVLKYDLKKQGLILCYVDCKKTDLDRFRLKLQDLENREFTTESVLNEKGRALFGCNLYLMASGDKDLVLNQKEKETVVEAISALAKAYPNYFRDYQNSAEFLEFQRTGRLTELSHSFYPFPKFYTPYDIERLFKKQNINYNEMKEYKKILNELDNNRTGRCPFIIEDLEE